VRIESQSKLDRITRCILGSVMTPPKHLARLGEIELLRGCTQRELRWIDQLASTRDIAAGRVLCRTGELGRECFVLLDGCVEVAYDGRGETYGRDALVGEIALLTPAGRRTATVTAVTDVRVLVFTRSEFRQLLAALPAVAHRILRGVARRLIDDSDMYQ
jgi:CRP-like cAMP-binding protein